MAASTYQVIALAIYFVAMIAIGLWANSKNNSLDDYVLGGRQLSPTVAALSAGASDDVRLAPHGSSRRRLTSSRSLPGVARRRSDHRRMVQLEVRGTATA